MEMENSGTSGFRLTNMTILTFKAALPGMHFMWANPVWEDFGWGPVSAQMRALLAPLPIPHCPKQLNPNFVSLGGAVLTIVPDFNGKTVLGHDGQIHHDG